MGMKVMYMISMVLVVVGAVNWGLVGLADMNLVTMLFGEGTMLTRLVYLLVGLAGLFMIFAAFKCKKCMPQ